VGPNHRTFDRLPVSVTIAHRFVWLGQDGGPLSGPTIGRERAEDQCPIWFSLRLSCQARRQLHVRQRVRAIRNVTLMDGYDVVKLTSNADRSRITGVTITSREGDHKRALTADLVVDATGRGSRTPAFLENLGYDRPVEDEVVMRLAYASQLLRIPPGMVKELLVIIGPIPARPTGMALLAHENDTWMLTVFGMVGREPPADYLGMLRFIEDFTPAHVMSALRCAEPLGEVARYRTPSSRWRRSDKMRRFPAGLLVFGDAIASFDPTYGQGMTVAALQSLALDRCLRRGAHGLAPRYFRAAAKPIGVAWQLAVGGDLNLPKSKGPGRCRCG
jgi:2-polyprenyl-6-methoxyphenol hydroxylase-like FAD-dependent oxidoreductase